jgi:hypothetical protein
MASCWRGETWGAKQLTKPVQATAPALYRVEKGGGSYSKVQGRRPGVETGYTPFSLPSILKAHSGALHFQGQEGCIADYRCQQNNAVAGACTPISTRTRPPVRFGLHRRTYSVLAFQLPAL